jgi:peptide/nickel transport system permease protein
MIPTLFLVTIIIFCSIRLIPGSVVDLIANNSLAMTDADRAAIEHQLGLDLPIHVQYARWIGNIILHGDFGNSLIRGTPVINDIVARLPVSLELGFLGIIISLLIAAPIGIFSAIRQDSVQDYVGRSVAITFIAVPNFWIALLVVVLPAIWWHWSPSIKLIYFWDDPVGNLVQFIIPAAILGMALSGGMMRMIRTMMLETLRQDYIRTAWAKGLKEGTVIRRHALKNALIPVVTVLGFQIPMVIGGAVILEQIFSLPGVGLLTINALELRDYTVLSGINLIVASFVMLINLLVDLTYAWLDPRIRYK